MIAKVYFRDFVPVLNPEHLAVYIGIVGMVDFEGVGVHSHYSVVEVGMVVRAEDEGIHPVVRAFVWATQWLDMVEFRVAGPVTTGPSVTTNLASIIVQSFKFLDKFIIAE